MVLQQVLQIMKMIKENSSENFKKGKNVRSSEHLKCMVTNLLIK